MSSVGKAVNLPSPSTTRWDTGWPSSQNRLVRTLYGRAGRTGSFFSDPGGGSFFSDLGAGPRKTAKPTTTRRAIPSTAARLTATFLGRLGTAGPDWGTVERLEARNCSRSW